MRLDIGNTTIGKAFDEFCYSTLDVQLKRPNGYELEEHPMRATVAVFEKPRRENLIFPVFRVRSPHNEGAGFDMV